MTLSTGTIQQRLEDIDADLAVRVDALEAAARAWFLSKRDREHDRAVVFLKTEGTVGERSSAADIATSMIGRAEEAEWEALRAVVRVLETRSVIGMALLKAYGKAAG